MQNQLKMAFGAMTMVVLVGACDQGFEPYGSSVGIRDASLQGDMGPARDLDDSASATASTSDWDTTFNVNVDRRDDAAMAIVSLGLSPEELRDLSGYRLVRTAGNGLEVQTEDGTVDEGRTDDTGDAFVDVIGCAGPNPGEWDFDEPADEVVVQVEESPDNPDEVVLSFVATFDAHRGLFGGDRSQVVTGNVIFLPEELGSEVGLFR